MTGTRSFLPGLEAMRRRLLVVAALMIAYGSLYPFHLAMPGSIDGALRDLLGQDLRIRSIGDLVGNVILFMPLGAAAAAGGRWRRPASLTLHVVLGTAYALLLQVMQLFLPERDAALVDVAWNAVGLVAGAMFAPILDRTQGRASGDSRAATVPLALLALWVVAELAPLVPALDWQGVKDALKPLFRADRIEWSRALLGAMRILAAGLLLQAVVAGARGRFVLLALVAATILAKPLIVGQRVDVETLLAATIGATAVLLLARSRSATRDAWLVAAMLTVTYVVDGLRPFRIAGAPAEPGWIPFAAVLGNLSVPNIVATAQSLYSFAAVLWLVRRAHGALLPATVALMLVVAVVEAAQVWIVGRSPDVTEVVIALLAGVLIGTTRPPGRLGARAGRAREAGEVGRGRLAVDGARADRPPAGVPGTAMPPQSVRADSGDVPGWLALPLAWAALTVALAAALRLPGVPYNFRELFLGGGHIGFIAIFALVPFWIGAGAAWVARRMAASRVPALAFPLPALAASLVSLLLLAFSVTDESLDDIAGSSNLWWFATKENLWGEWARPVFVALGQDVVSFLERPVRFAAIYVPPAAFISFGLLLTDWRRPVRRPWPKAFALVAWTLPWLWLCKAIGFDWSSTDNLNELIAREGALGMGGGFYLYLLIALFAAGVTTLARAPTSLRGAALAVAVVIATTVLGWGLLNLGLEPRVQKYGLEFSGVQFLLGPDRSHTLGAGALFARWSAVYAGGLLLVSLGARLGASTWVTVRARTRFRRSSP